MIVLAFDTCFNACSVAIGVQTAGAVDIVSARLEPMATGQAERLLPMISECLAEAKLTMAGIGKIAVTTGPGTFTGTRIGLSAAKGLALVNKTPVAGLSSLHLMARQVALSAPQRDDIGIVIDVRRDEVYIQLFDSSGLNPKTTPALMTVAKARELLGSGPVALAGNGAALVAMHDSAQIFSCKGTASLLPDARYAVEIVGIGNLPDITVMPLYLRAPDAKPSSAPALQRQ